MSHIGKYKRSTCRTRIIGALVGIRKWSEWCRQSPIGVATTRRYWFIHPCHQQVSPQMKPCQEPPWSNRDFEPSLLDNHCWTITAESPLLDNHCRPTLLNDIENQNWELAVCVRSRGIFGFPSSFQHYTYFFVRTDIYQPSSTPDWTAAAPWDTSVFLVCLWNPGHLSLLTNTWKIRKRFKIRRIFVEDSDKLKNGIMMMHCAKCTSRTNPEYENISGANYLLKN